MAALSVRLDRDAGGIWLKPNRYAGSLFLVVVLVLLYYRWLGEDALGSAWLIHVLQCGGGDASALSSSCRVLFASLVITYWYIHYAVILVWISRERSSRDTEAVVEEDITPKPMEPVAVAGSDPN